MILLTREAAIRKAHDAVAAGAARVEFRANPTAVRAGKSLRLGGFVRPTSREKARIRVRSPENRAGVAASAPKLVRIHLS